MDNIGILIGVVLYELVTIVGVSLYISKSSKHATTSKGDDFVLAGKGMGTISFAATLALTILGAAHIWGATQNGWHYGAVGVWFGIGGVTTICVITQLTGPIVRKLGVNTMPELMGKLFGEKARIAIACCTGPLMAGMIMLETRCIAVTLSAITGWDLGFAAVVGGIMGILYVVFFGMKEIAKLNIINAVAMYIGLIIAAIAFASVLPGGWAGIASEITQQSAINERVLNIVGDKELIMSFAVTSIICFTCFHGVSQMGLQPAMSAKNPKAVRRGIWLAAPLNGLFCVIPVCIGMAAKVMPEYNAYGDSMAPAMLIVEVLPSWVVVLVMAAFLGALLSTFAMATLCPATLYAKDLYTQLYKKDATDEEQIRIMRIVIVVAGVVGIIGANLDPMVSTGINWIFSFGIPIFVLAMIGLFWKRSEKAALWTLGISWIINILWTMTPIKGWIGLADLHIAYVALPVAVLLGVILTIVLPSKPGYFKHLKQEKEMAAVNGGALYDGN